MLNLKDLNIGFQKCNYKNWVIVWSIEGVQKLEKKKDQIKTYKIPIKKS